jgi:hypothetical protein
MMDLIRLNVFLATGFWDVERAMLSPVNLHVK